MTNMSMAQCGAQAGPNPGVYDKSYTTHSIHSSERHKVNINSHVYLTRPQFIFPALLTLRDGKAPSRME